MNADGGFYVRSIIVHTIGDDTADVKTSVCVPVAPDMRKGVFNAE